MEKVLFAVSEVYPYIKTGGLADVASSLPRALKAQHVDIRIILPAYPRAMEQAKQATKVAQWQQSTTGDTLTLWEDRLPQSLVKVWLLQHPIFERDGGPYTDDSGTPWPDNAQRFTTFCRGVVDIALGKAGLMWEPNLLHCNDWQTALIPPLLSQTDKSTVFTIHNLAYQGLFDRETFDQLNLPSTWWAMNSMEFYGNFSFIKGGLVFADMVNTVSPSYAREISTAEFGCGLETLLQQKQNRLVGILNGLDTKIWDPRHDPLIAHPYGLKNLSTKKLNKTTLQHKCELTPSHEKALIGNVGRMAEQKGLDLLLSILPHWVEQPVQFVLLGSGDKKIEKALQDWQKRYPQSIALHIGYDEILAHQIEAGADIFLMPSRFEPCGLNQLYSLRYGTIPVVHGVGGLADSVVDFDQVEGATGFVFNEPSAESLHLALTRAVATFQQPKRWQNLMRTAMKQDFTWKSSAKQYVQLYRQAQKIALGKRAHHINPV